MTAVERWLAYADVRPEAASPALAPLLARLRTTPAAALSVNDPVATTPAERQAAVLILIATDGPDGPDVLLQQRADTLRSHAGQIAFPGGSRDATDTGPAHTAVREAVEETGLDPAGVAALALLPRLHIPPSRFDVTAVLAHWHAPSPVTAVDPGETARVMRVPLRRLADPAIRAEVELPSGWRGPTFRLDDGALVWGFTGEVLAAVLALGGWD